MNTIIKRSFLNALGTVAYITLVATVMRSLERFAGNEPDGFFAPVLFLTMFIVSAAITGGLVIGRPLLVYIRGERSEAVKLFLCTIGWLLLALAVLLLVNFA